MALTSDRVTNHPKSTIKLSWPNLCCALLLALDLAAMLEVLVLGGPGVLVLGAPGVLTKAICIQPTHSTNRDVQLQAVPRPPSMLLQS